MAGPSGTRNVSAPALQTPREQTARLPNIRVHRDPKPWTVLGRDLRITVEKTEHQDLVDASHWRLNMVIEPKAGGTKPWRLISVRSFTPGVDLPALSADAAGNAGGRSFSFTFKAPYLCPVDKTREYVSLDISYELDGKIVNDTIAVDFRCLIGDTFDRVDGSKVARLTQKYLRDPVIDSLVALFRDTPVGKPKEEARRLDRWLNDNGVGWLQDPPGYVSGWVGDAAYFLSPSEMVFLGGGDCEDHAILSAAFLTRRNIPSWMLPTPFHAWVCVQKIPGGAPSLDIDLAHLDSPEPGCSGLAKMLGFVGKTQTPYPHPFHLEIRKP
ncbi:MAG: hypothetical protein WC956_01345 [bacterium]